MNWQLCTVLTIAWLSSTTWPAFAEEPAHDSPGAIPTKVFFRHPDLGAVQLSPSGRWLAAAIRGKDERVALAVIDLDGKSAPAIVASYSDADVRSFNWVNDERLVYNIIDFQSGGRTNDSDPGFTRPSETAPRPDS